MAAKKCYFTKVSQPPKKKSECGDSIRLTYELKIMPDGKKELVSTGKVNMYEEIQSHKDSCDLGIILRKIEEMSRMGLQSDENMLNKRKGFFADVSGAPTSYIEMFQRVNDANNTFEHLPLEVRKMFNNSASEFFASFGTDKYAQAMSLLFPQIIDKEKDIPKDNPKESEVAKLDE